MIRFVTILCLLVSGSAWAADPAILIDIHVANRHSTVTVDLYNSGLGVLLSVSPGQTNVFSGYEYFLGTGDNLELQTNGVLVAGPYTFDEYPEGTNIVRYGVLEADGSASLYEGGFPAYPGEQEEESLYDMVAYGMGLGFLFYGFGIKLAGIRGINVAVNRCGSGVDS